jgi:hypothetical protein
MKHMYKALRGKSTHSVILKVLKENGKPMKVKEITKQVLEKKSFKSKTPYNSISAVLQRSIFVTKTGMATYELKTEDSSTSEENL